MRKLISLAIAALFIAPAVLAEGEVYRWKDPNGVWHYSDQPQPGAELVKKSGSRSSSSNSAPAAAAVATAPAARLNSESGAPPVTREVAQQVRSEAAAAKAEQCKKAEAAYQSAVVARRIYKTDEAGKRVFLNDAEIDAARLEARSNRDLACGPSP